MNRSCLAAASGAIVNGWRLEGAHMREIQIKDEQYARLADTVREQSSAVEAMKAGVIDFIEKPFSDDVLISAVRSAFERLIDHCLAS